MWAKQYLASAEQQEQPYFIGAKSNANANAKIPLFSLITIRFNSCEVRRPNQALVI